MQNIVITGGSSGFGKAMAYEFSKKNNNVLIAGRNKQNLMETRRYIQYETIGNCFIKQCDVVKTDDLVELSDYAQDLFKGKIDHWINNAAICEGPEDFDDVSLETIEQVILTNVLAVMMGTKMATNIRSKNIYAISGHGSNSFKTPEFSIYGASKASISQFYASVIDEVEQTFNSNDDKKSSFHIIAPGIMKTQLTKKLLNHNKLNMLSKMMIDKIAMNPEDVASKVVPKILTIQGNGHVIRPFF